MDTNKYLQLSEESKMGKLTVFIVDKQLIFRQGLRQALSPHEDIEVVGECDPDADAWSIVESLLPDIVLVDVGVYSLSGFGIARQIASRCPKTAVVILAQNPDEDQLFRAIQSGAVAFLSKDIPPDKLVSILRRVGWGEYPINDCLLTKPNTARQVLRLFQSFALNDMVPLMTPLSHREMEILKYIAEGNPNKRIAYALSIREQTIKNHITSIMRKLNANDRTHAVVLAIRRGWLNIADVSEIPAEKELVIFR